MTSTPTTTHTEALVDGPTELSVTLVEETGLKVLDAKKLKITKSTNPTTLPADLQFKWGHTFTDHMLVISHDPELGWSAPEIKPYGPLSLDPASACFQYAPSLFEGMKAYRSTIPGNPPILFRPDMNMARMRRSADRVELPDFDPEELIKLIKILVNLDQHLIPPPPCALYLRPTMIGTRPTLGVAPSTSCLLYVILSPVGPFFPTKSALPTSLSSPPVPNGPSHPYATTFHPISLLATTSSTRSWPGGVGAYKLSGNYSPCFKPQKVALGKGYQQNLWCIDERAFCEPGAETMGMEGEVRIQEVGQMNLFVVFEGVEGVEICTPELDGTILPGVTRDSILTLARSHSTTPLTGLTHALKVSERRILLSELVARGRKGEVLEVFGSGTAAVLCPVSKLGLQDPAESDVQFPSYPGGLGPVARAIFEVISDIQEGRMEHEWAVKCI